MKKIIYTQRVEVVSKYNERRDCADQNIVNFIRACGYLAFPIPNIPEATFDFISELKPNGIVFTGGNDLVKYGGNAPERDATERNLIEYSMSHGIPLFGFCRGMQMIGDFLGAKLVKIIDHAGTRHKIFGEIKRDVNSYHNYSVNDLPGNIEIIAKSIDGVVEAFRYQCLTGVMWHPEREYPFQQEDIAFFRSVFN